MKLTAAEQTFIDAHRWAVLTTLGGSGAPSNSVVAYAQDGDKLVISTPGGTFKRRSVDADSRVNVCIISNAEPFNFVAIEGVAQVTKADLERQTRLVFANIEGTGFELPADLPGWLAQQQRVILEVQPTRCHSVIR